MGMHPSLKRAGKSGKHKTVLKRAERIKWLMEKGRWASDSKATGLPKIKIVKLKTVKKEKPKEAKQEESEKKSA
jgi:small basic protein (TIGR04137 family)